MNKQLYILGVVGGSHCTDKQSEVAEAVGRVAAEMGAVLLCGGGSGVMESAARGAHHAGGLVLGILPHADKRRANPYVSIPVLTGMGDARNVINILTADLVVAIGGAGGTLSEIALALKNGKTVYGFDTCEPIYSESERPVGFQSFDSIEELLEAVRQMIC
jgi:uncharacterized protein (TIGR00725 family)